VGLALSRYEFNVQLDGVALAADRRRKLGDLGRLRLRLLRTRPSCLKRSIVKEVRPNDACSLIDGDRQGTKASITQTGGSKYELCPSLVLVFFLVFTTKIKYSSCYKVDGLR